MDRKVVFLFRNTADSKTYVTIVTTLRVDVVRIKSKKVAALNFLRTGNCGRSTGYLVHRTEVGRWWSSVSVSVENSHALDTNSTYTIRQNINLRGGGFAIRCVVREGYTVPYCACDFANLAGNSHIPYN